MPDTVNSDDPVFPIFPLQKSQGKVHSASVDHDELLYPAHR